MPRDFITSELPRARGRIADKVRELRRDRGWTQAELGNRLGLSQGRLSEIERGGGSFTAEQLIAVLVLFNVDIAEFLPPADIDDELQNALIQQGATHLRQVPGVALTGRYGNASDVISAVLLEPRSTRFVTALGPVLLERLDGVSLPALRARLDISGRAARFGWLLENVRDALLLPPPGEDKTWRRKASRAITVLGNELDRFSPPTVSPESPPDLFDTTIRSSRSLDLVWNQQASPISKRWGIASDIQPDHFREAIWQAHESR